MRKCLPILLILLLVVAGCGRREKTALNIGDIQITAGEFDRAFKSSRFSYQGKRGRELYLDNYISKKLMLAEAEKQGIDKEPRFLSDIQNFWEQGLLKIILDKKTREISLRVNVGDEEVQDYYERNKEERFPGQDLSEVYDQIKWLLLKTKQGQAMSDWVDSLKQNTTIVVNRKLLGME